MHQYFQQNFWHMLIYDHANTMPNKIKNTQNSYLCMNRLSESKLEVLNYKISVQKMSKIQQAESVESNHYIPKNTKP